MSGQSEQGVLLQIIKPGRPMQNGFIERFNRSYREAVLDSLCFKAWRKCASKLSSGSRSTTKNDLMSLWATRHPENIC